MALPPAATSRRARPPADVPAPAPAAGTGIPDTEIGLFKGSVFDDPTPPPVHFLERMPGNNDEIPPLFDGAPPRVPHVVVDFLPITAEENGCLECHLSEDPEDAPQLPESHRTDLRRAPDAVGEGVAGARYMCLLCHVPLTDAEPFPESAPGE